ncbi:MAG: acyl-CoA thioester hydrolase [Actinomycetota bacterium]|jgi:acyl-CoA thioester hydrolase|nr:acyl-CoA thioester hydrolase [Actinomycetota bacterium]
MSTPGCSRRGAGIAWQGGAVPVWSAPVRYQECDQQGIVFNAHYLTWCDEAVTAWMAAVGTPYDGLHARDLDTRVVASALDWMSSARWGDTVDLDVAVARLGRTSFAIGIDVSVGERLCCRVVTTYVMTDLAGSSVPVPDDLRAAWS